MMTANGYFQEQPNIFKKDSESLYRLREKEGRKTDRRVGE